MAVHTIQNNRLTVRVKDAGAELCSIKDAAGREYLFDANPAYWGRSSPVLFPFVGSLKNKEFLYEGKRYPMGQHGFARDMDFSMIGQEADYICFRLESNEETLARYPLPFALQIGYQLNENAVHVLWKVENPSPEKPLYFSIGAHPAFLCPPEGGGMEGCYLGFDVPGNLSYQLLNGQGLLVQDMYTLPLEEGLYRLHPGLFDRDALIVEGPQTGRVWLADRDKRPFITVLFKNAPLFGVWSPAGKNAPFVCIEPWYGRCDGVDFSGDLAGRKYGNCILPGGCFQADYKIIVDRA